jgi:rubrerythrin
MTSSRKILFAAAAFAVLAGSVSSAETAKAPKKPETTTLENLQIAYNGELKAKTRYEAFAAKAETEGYLGVAALFRAAAASEAILADKHAKAIHGGTIPAMKPLEAGSTEENLKAAIEGEAYELLKMYPVFIKRAEADKNQQAMYGFKGAMAAGKMHSQMCSMALANLKDWKVKKKFIVCRTCGYTTMNLKLKICPVCSQPREQFTEIE